MTGVAFPGKLPEMHVGVAVYAAIGQGFVDGGVAGTCFVVAFLAGYGCVLAG
jgi:hypothetical protein